MALSVMYGENCFHLETESADMDDYRHEIDLLKDDDQDAIPIEASRHNPWKILACMPHTPISNVVSSVDCLDMISQTSSGQTFLKHLQIDFGRVTWVRVMDGVLLRILERLRGLQSVELKILSDWEDLVPERDSPEEAVDWHERYARNFLLLVEEELSHIKKITMGYRAVDVFDDPTIINWMTDELEKRNEAWVPPLPSYKKFRRTFSPMSIMDAEVAKSVVQLDDELRPGGHKYSFARLAELAESYGVF